MPETDPWREEVLALLSDWHLEFQVLAVLVALSLGIGVVRWMR